MVEAEIKIKATDMESLDKAILEIYTEVGKIEKPSVNVSVNEISFSKGEVDFCYSVKI